MTINLLDEHLINKIAAGEVIERPSSVIKELVENSVDAQSTHINVQVIKGGIESLAVEDNGVGIPATEVTRAFLRHATSKIAKEEDLYNINSMGFRGEALPSIASIARVTLITAQEDGVGTKMVIEGGQEISIENIAAPKGTRITVEDIFYNTPARRKFLKSPISENNAIYNIIVRLALSRPDISVSYSNEKKKYFKTPGKGDLLATLQAIYGHEYLKYLIPVEYQGERITIKGLISRPEVKKVNRKNQIFYVNNRVIQSPVISRAIEEAYRGFLVSKEHPVIILFVQIANADIDINVHPQKNVVRFRDEGSIFRVISKAIREKLHTLNYKFIEEEGSSPNDFSPGNTFHSFSWGKIFRQEDNSSQGHNIFLNEGQANPNFAPSGVGNNYLDNQYSNNEGVPDFIIIGQLFGAYILVEKENTFWLVDQHAAHEKINYIKLKEASLKRNVPSQSLAIPLTIDLSADKIDILEENQEFIKDLGFNIELLSYNAIVVRDSPAYIQGKEFEVIHEIIDLLAATRQTEFKDEVITMMACKQSIKAGQLLSNREMYILIRDLLILDDYWHCPHGRPTIIEITNEQLNRKFKR
jgi:DNA mismatch repair protein MutL